MRPFVSAALECTAPAKVNLALHITGRRADGYHLLESLAVFTHAGDHLRAEAAESDSFTVHGPWAHHVPEDEQNLVLQVRDLLRRRFRSRELPPVALRLEKNLPVASGIGGGSSDAAAALRLLARYWALETTEEDLASIALEIGADVPMCLVSRPLSARGIGEELEPVSPFPSLPLLLVNPGIPIKTPAVFAQLKERQNEGLPKIPACRSAVEVVRWLHSTRNDLESAAISLVPEIASVLDVLSAQDALLCRMSGSGATCFAIFEKPEDVEHTAAKIRKEHPGWFVLPTRTTTEEYNHA